MSLGTRLKALRQEIGLSQEALGAQGFVSTPGWIKIENGQRQASERLIAKLVEWLVTDKYIRASAAAPLKEELLVRKYLDNLSPFVRGLARNRLAGKPWGEAALQELKAPAPQPTRAKQSRAQTR